MLFSHNLWNYAPFMADEHEERTLKLSLYIDGELPANERADIEAKIKNDPEWKAEYQSLADSELKIENVAGKEDDWHDADFTARVSSKIRTLPKPSGVRKAEPAPPAPATDAPRGRQLREEPPPQRGFNPVRLALHMIFLLVAIGLFVWKFLLAAPTTTKPAEKPAEQEKIALKMIGKLLHGYANNGVGPNEPEYAGWVNPTGMRADRETALLLNGGMQLFIGEESVLRASGPNQQILELAGGEIFLPKATPSTRPQFTKIKVGDDIEIDASNGGVEVLLPENTIRAVGVTLTVKNAQRTVYVPDGCAVKTDLAGIESYDPRKIGARWSSIAYYGSTSAEGSNLAMPDFAAVWPQVHGDAQHSGVSPFKGPPAISAAAFLPWDLSEGGKPVEVKPCGPAIALSRREFFVALSLEGARTQLFSVSVSDQYLAKWAPLGPVLNGPSTLAPVLSPDGLIVTGTNGAAGGSSAVVQAWDTKLNKVAYTKDLGTTLAGLTVARVNGKTLLLCSTFKGLIALDEKSNEIWTYSGVTDFAVPACVGPEGVIVALSKSGRIAALDVDGKAISQTRMDPYGALRAPVFMRTENGGYFQAFTELGNEVTIEASGKAGASLSGRFQGAGRWMLATRVFSQANSVFFVTSDPSEVKLPFPGSISALAQDADHYVYATLGRTVFRIDTKHLATPPESAQAEKGTIIPGGLAILPRRILVTTTEGLGILE
jgi:hypothetical protein